MAGCCGAYPSRCLTRRADAFHLTPPLVDERAPIRSHVRPHHPTRGADHPPTSARTGSSSGQCPRSWSHCGIPPETQEVSKSLTPAWDHLLGSGGAAICTNSSPELVEWTAQPFA